jgi:chemotaxis protein CheX
MQLLLEDIEAIGAMVMESIAGVVLEPTAGEIPRERPALTGCVHIDGAWNGAALVECELPLARRITAVLFDRPAGDVSLHDVRDALGEITNMIGGNVKALLPAPSRLSLPTVVEGADYAVTVPRTRPAGVVSFRAGAEILVIRILAAEMAPAEVRS